MWDKLNSGLATQEEVDSIYQDICILAVLSGIEIDKAKRAYQNIEVGAELYENTYSTLTKLKENNRLFIVSNCGHGFVEAFMKQSHTEGFFEDYEYCLRTGLVTTDSIFMSS